MPESNQYDVVIVGGGIVGLTFACALIDTPLKIAIVEERLFSPQPKKSPSDRVSAVTRSSQGVFNRLDVWSKIPKEKISPYQEMHVWDAKGNGVIHFNSADIHEEALGFIIENAVMHQALLERLQHRELTWFCPAALKSFELQDKSICVELADGKHLDCRLVVGADGAQSSVRHQAGIEMTHWDYGQHALVATVETELSHQRTAWQRFLPSGPLAFLPLSDTKTSSIVWSTTFPEIEQLLNMDDERFKNVLATAFDHRLGAIQHVGSRSAFPLRMQHAKHYVQPRVALLGDAAHTLHPLAGQGLNLGLSDAACLAEIIQEAETKERDIGLLHTLRRYERSRKGNNVSMTMAVEGFKQLFSNEFAATVWARNLGLNVADHLSFFKNLVMRRV